MYECPVLRPALIALLVGKVPAGNGFWVDTALAMGYAALAMLDRRQRRLGGRTVGCGAAHLTFPPLWPRSR